MYKRQVEGKVILDGEDIYDKRVDTTLLRKKVGMVCLLYTSIGDTMPEWPADGSVSLQDGYILVHI